ncbi:hypothetical protein [Breznakia pachnodae]|uniref:P-II family nitrogen regulator n=1 Tax=Breznakia pachnodae TaxID=265178 RepID=A0ABU0E7N5_9FIRM|nr:hypothetical protein [Breznakia pachnodae]MDQ0362909.1 hypothetical protein [Breznakia pachnodae]
MKDSIIKLRLKLVVTIVDRNKGCNAIKLFKSLGVHWHFTVSGEGTANSEMMELLGLGSSDKSIALCIIPQFRVEEFLETINRELHLDVKGNGVGFTIPISGVNHPIIHKIEKEISMESIKTMKQELEQMVEKQKKETIYSVVLGVINQGYSEEVMSSAKETGVRGGTVIHARKVGVEDAVKFLGISVQEEKEILMIVTTKENRHDLMKKLSKEHGITSETHGVFLSLPVEDVIGIQLPKE